MNLIFLIPTLNEEKNIAATLDKVNECKFVKEIILIDGNSTDRTVEIAQNYSVTILKQTGQGKGNAVLEAIATMNPSDAVLMVDGDNTYEPRDGIKFLPYYANGVLINGSRFLKQMLPNAMP